MSYSDNQYAHGNVKAASPTDVIAFSGFLSKVFIWMAVGLALTALVSLYVSQQEDIVERLTGGAIMVLFLVLIVMVMVISVGIWKMPVGLAIALYLAYAALNGVVLSFVFLIYTQASIASTFFIAAGMFGGMAVYGYVTDRDLTGVGSLAVMGLWGIILASIVNIFLGSEAIYWAVTYIGVAVFLGLTAYDIQRFKAWGQNPSSPDIMARGAIIGALHLYLDFINLFLLLLRIFGRRR